MFRLKQIPEDFIVSEEYISEPGSGPYYCFELKKKSMTTSFALSIISSRLHIPLKDIGCAGNKDKDAVTSQRISIRSRKDLSKFCMHENNLSLDYICRLDAPVSLGCLKSNRFSITVRNLESSDIPETCEYFPNYFDSQRFSKNNSEIGKLIVKKDFRKAAELLKNNNHSGFDEKISRDSSNCVGAICTIPKKILMIYLHSYQSELFNRMLNNHIKKNYPHEIKEFDFGEISFTEEHDDTEFPLIGFDTDISQDIVPILKEENISLRDFIIRQLPNLSLEGSMRKSFARAENIRFSILEDDELNSGKKKIAISFSLPPGSYATMFIKSLFA